MKYILLSFVTMLIFGIIDSLIFLFAEEKLDGFLISYTELNGIERPILLGGISASVAILISGSFHDNIMHKYDILKHPIIDSISILLGAILVIYFYRIYKIYFNISVSTRKDRDLDKDHEIDLSVN